MSAHLSIENLLRYLRRSIPPSHLIEVDDHLSECVACQNRLAAIALADPNISGSSLEIVGAVGSERPLGVNPTLTPKSASPKAEKPAAIGDTFSKTQEPQVTYFGALTDEIADTEVVSPETVPPRTSPHLSYELLEASVDRKLTNEEENIVRTHLLECQSCSDELRDLQSFAVDVARGSKPRAHRQTNWSNLWEALSSWFTFRRSIFWALASLVLFAMMLGEYTTKAPTPKEVAGNPGVKIEAASSQDATIFDAGTMEDDMTAAGVIANEETMSRGRSGRKPHYSFPSLSDHLHGLDPKIQILIIDSIKRDRSEILIALRNLASMPGSLAGGVQLLSPVGTFALSSTPTFRWAAPAGVDGYTVHVYDSEFNAVESSPVVTAPEWKSNVPLRSDRTYVWRVQTTKNGEAVSEPIASPPLGRFRILDSSQRKLITELKRSCPEAHLAIGIVLARDGVIDDAVKEFEAVPQSDPNYSSAQKFVKDLRQLQVTAR